MRRFVAVVTVCLVTALVAIPSIASAKGHGTATALRQRLLSVHDLSAGWSVTHRSSSGGGLMGASCLSATHKPAKHWPSKTASFVQGSNFPQLDELVSTGPQVHKVWRKFKHTLAKCRTARWRPADGVKAD